MVKSSKWMDDLKPGLAWTEAARKALRRRLRTVWDFAPLAAKKCGDDLEYVHQLRVATRRARATLHLFEDVLPKTEKRWFKRQLRNLRRAAGESRDLDVFGLRLKTLTQGNEESPLGAVSRQVVQRREEAQLPLVKAYRKAKQKGFPQKARRLSKRIHWAGNEREPTFAEAAQTKLVPLVEEFFEAGSADLSTSEPLHQLRIVGKSLRYAMELLASAFDESFRKELYPTFAEVQEKLGIINDHATAAVMVNTWLVETEQAPIRAELSNLIDEEKRQFDETSEAFRAWWTPQRRDELRRQFARVLDEASSSPTGNSFLDATTP